MMQISCVIIEVWNSVSGGVGRCPIMGEIVGQQDLMLSLPGKGGGGGGGGVHLRLLQGLA